MALVEITADFSEMLDEVCTAVEAAHERHKSVDNHMVIMLLGRLIAAMTATHCDTPEEAVETLKALSKNIINDILFLKQPSDAAEGHG
jgi:hypothetical protein